MLRMNRQGFTLIELMVVIVIIGVLASLAIPRFTEASAKAKMAEAPGVLKSFESAYLAAAAEVGAVTGGANALIFDPKQTSSKWFTYEVQSAAGTEVDPNAGDPRICEAKSIANIGTFAAGNSLYTAHMGGGFKHTANSDAAVKAATKMIPNFDVQGVGVDAECGANEFWGIVTEATTSPAAPAVWGCVAEE